MVDVRKELSLINKHIRQHNREAGEFIIWYEFDPFAGAASAGSFYDDVYDEGAPGDGGRRYLPGVRVPTIYVEEREDKFTMQEDGRQPTQNIYVAVLFNDMLQSGVTLPREYQPRLNDIFWYDSRFYKVSDFHVRGRLPSEVVIGIVGFEVYIDQEFNLDIPPTQPVTQDRPWPDTFPSVGV